MAKTAASESEFTREHPDPDAATHACPPDGKSLTPCCGQSPWEMHPWRNRITTDPELVTCKGSSNGPR